LKLNRGGENGETSIVLATSAAGDSSGDDVSSRLEARDLLKTERDLESVGIVVETFEIHVLEVEDADDMITHVVGSGGVTCSRLDADDHGIVNAVNQQRSATRRGAAVLRENIPVLN
jgi:hypothetical protein